MGVPVRNSLTSDSQARPKFVLWKWSLLITVVVLTALIWQCGSGLVQGGRLSDAAVKSFHQQLDTGDYDGILSDAATDFTPQDKREDIISFLKAVHAKLGNSRDAKRSNVNVAATATGIFVTVVYNSTFDAGPAVERFT